MASASDRELVERARGGDADAFGTFLRRHQRRIYRLVAHLTKSATDAEDVMQDVFVRAYQGVESFQGGSEPFTWLYRIAVNLSLNHIRGSRSKRRTTSLEDDPRIAMIVADSRPGAGGDPSSATHKRRLTEALAGGVDTLSETLRTTLILVCIDGISHDDAAEILGCSSGTIAWRIHEARRRLKRYLEERGFGGDLE